MITHTIESYWIPSQNKTESKLQILKIPPNFIDKMCKYEMDPMSFVEDTERTRFCPQTDRRMDGRTDKVIPVYPPINFVEAGGIITKRHNTHRDTNINRCNDDRCPAKEASYQWVGHMTNKIVKSYHIEVKRWLLRKLQLFQHKTICRKLCYFFRKNTMSLQRLLNSVLTLISDKSFFMCEKL